VPDLRILYSIDEFRTPTWPTILPVLTPTEPTNAIFPSLQGVVFLANHGLECTDELYKLPRDFVIARKGTLNHLSISGIKYMDILNPLRDHIARLEVRFAHFL
jgi:hypothetical protein